MQYQPFLIAPFQTGLDTDAEPWLVPQDAFVDIKNGHIHHGYIEKRQGYRKVGDMVYGRPITTATTANPAVFTVADATGLSDGDTISLHYLSGGTWESLNLQKYTISNLVGATFNLVDSNGTTVDGSGLGAYTGSSGRLGTFPADRMMGIFRYITSTNEKATLVADTKRVALYNAASNIFQPLDLFDLTSTLQTNNDVFSSSNTDFIWSANWQNPGVNNRVYFTNGKAYESGTDGILYYDGANNRVTQFQPSLRSPGGTLLLYGCKLIFSIRQRLLVLYTHEYNGSSTIEYPQRARWCKVQSPDSWKQDTPGEGGFVDAPTGEQIISAQQVQDVIIVHFTNSVWAIRPVPDPALPFRWEKINSFRSIESKVGSTGFDRYSFAVGIRGITATDGIETRRVDNRIENFVSDDINANKFNKVFVDRSFENRRTWVLYPDIESDDSNAALIYDEDSASYSKYDISLNVLGQGIIDQDYACEDFTEANNLDFTCTDFDDETCLSFVFSQNAEAFFGGNLSGEILLLETQDNDNGSPIDFSLESAAWNPFKEAGKECQLGYIDFFLDTEQNCRFEIEFYKNNSETPYATQALDCLPDLNFIASVGDIEINADPTTGFTVSANSHGLSEGDEFYFYKIKGSQFYNDRQWTVGAAVTENSFNVAEDITSFADSITNISQSNPAVVTSTDHNFSNGDRVYITQVSGMVQVNNTEFTVANVTADTFELQGIDSSAYTAYAGGGYAFDAYLSGGEIFERKFYRTKVWKRAYAGGIGYQHRVKINQTESTDPFKIHAMKPWFRPRGKRLIG